MKNPPLDPVKTEMLLKALRETPDINLYVSQYEHNLARPIFHDYLNTLCRIKQIKKSAVITRSTLHRTYGYQVFSGQKMPSRDKVILLAFGFELSIEACQQMLFNARYERLSPKDIRDATILFSLLNGHSVPQVNDLLDALGETVLT